MECYVWVLSGSPVLFPPVCLFQLHLLPWDVTLLLGFRHPLPRLWTVTVPPSPPFPIASCLSHRSPFSHLCQPCRSFGHRSGWLVGPWASPVTSQRPSNVRVQTVRVFCVVNDGCGVHPSCLGGAWCRSGIARFTQTHIQCKEKVINLRRKGNLRIKFYKNEFVFSLLSSHTFDRFSFEPLTFPSRN